MSNCEHANNKIDHDFSRHSLPIELVYPQFIAATGNPKSGLKAIENGHLQWFNSDLMGFYSDLKGY